MLAADQPHAPAAKLTRARAHARLHSLRSAAVQGTTIACNIIYLSRIFMLKPFHPLDGTATREFTDMFWK